MQLNLRGIIPPMVTPLTEDKSLDHQSLKGLIEHLISGGVHGIFLLGTNGEAPSLTYALRKELISKACGIINGRVPILVGITDTSFEGSIEMAEHARISGADALVIAPPYYFPISNTEMVSYLEELVPKLPLPFLLYNMPSCTKMNLSMETVKIGKELGALGIKDSSGDLQYLYKLLETFKDSPEFAIIVGTEGFLSQTIANGGHGAVAGGANFLPRMFVDLYDASVSGDKNKVVEIGGWVAHLYNTIYNVGDDASRITKGIKCALSLMGICDDHMALPLRRFDAGDRAKIKGHLENFGKHGIV
ncbi:MAG: dihydrodipicolinate synthase family protein [Bacteroidota bacterium]